MSGLCLVGSWDVPVHLNQFLYCWRQSGSFPDIGNVYTPNDLSFYIGLNRSCNVHWTTGSPIDIWSRSMRWQPNPSLYSAADFSNTWWPFIHKQKSLLFDMVQYNTVPYGAEIRLGNAGLEPKALAHESWIKRHYKPVGNSVPPGFQFWSKESAE